MTGSTLPLPQKEDTIRCLFLWNKWRGFEPEGGSFAPCKEKEPSFSLTISSLCDSILILQKGVAECFAFPMTVISTFSPVIWVC